MAITRTAKGTAEAFLNPGDTISLASVSIASGATIVVAVVSDALFLGAQTVVWNGQSLAQVVLTGVGGSFALEVWVKHNCTGGTGTVDAQMGSAESGPLLMAVIELAGSGTLTTDKSHTGTGTGTSPSSGATATTTKANEMLLGFIGQAQGSLNVVGTWSSSFSDGQSVRDTTSVAIAYNDGFRSVSSAAAYTAAKTGATSAPWAAVIITFYEPTAWTKSVADTITGTDALGKAIGKVTADTVTGTDAQGKAVGKPVSDTLTASDDVAKAVNKLIADVLTATDSLRTEELEYYPGIEAASLIGQPPDPWTGVPLPLPQTAYSVAQRGLKSCGLPYFSALQTNLTASNGIGGSETNMIVVVTLQAMPAQLASPDEPHWLASWHEAVSGGRELFSLGVTPSGRLCAKTVDSPLVLSPIGAITADGRPHVLTLQMYGGAGPNELGLDGVVLVAYVAGLSVQGPLSATGLPVRFMLFNGIEGKTRCACIIHHVEVGSDNQSVRWPVDEGHGLAVDDEEYVSDGTSEFVWVNRQLLTPAGPGPSDYSSDWRLTAQWYDPTTLGYPRLWGGISPTNINACASRQKRPFYVNRNPVSVPFTPVTRP